MVAYHDSFPTLIAEIGLNHSGSVEVARSLIYESAKAGFDSIKFQYRRKVSTDFRRKEIGEELIIQELSRSYLSPNEILDLCQYAHSLGVQTGISFFSAEEMSDFESRDLGSCFDFFKVPSAELENEALIRKMLRSKKQVFISTGMHSLASVAKELEKYSKFPNWLPMHCVSNYPVLIANASLSRISALSSLTDRPAGFSSHDEDWKVCLVAIGAGASAIERHVTLSKEAPGLDQSSSSTPDELKTISTFWQERKGLLQYRPQPNAGEIINLQNLGRSYYSKRVLNPGELIKLDDFDYRPPRAGLGYRDFQERVGSVLKVGMAEGEALSDYHFQDRILVREWGNSKKNGVCLPVRGHDLQPIKELFRLDNYELHLSGRDVDDLPSLTEFSAGERWAIHLPDYLDADTLLEPFSPLESVAAASQELIKKIFAFASDVSQKTGRKIPLVTSFTSPSLSRREFCDRYMTNFSSLHSDAIQTTIQWMPPYAWYFGGSVAINKNNNLDDLPTFREYKVPITLDSSHLIMGSKHFGFESLEVVKYLKENIKHIHLSDALDSDDEGRAFSDDSPNNQLIRYLLREFDCLKTVEVWQGHLNNFEGFRSAMEWLESFK